MIMETSLEHVLDESMPKLEKNTRQLNYLHIDELHDANCIQDNAELHPVVDEKEFLQRELAVGG